MCPRRGLAVAQEGECEDGKDFNGHLVRDGEALKDPEADVTKDMPKLEATKAKTTRRKATQGEIAQVRSGTLPMSAGVYIGRVPGPMGVLSKWANPIQDWTARYTPRCRGSL